MKTLLCFAALAVGLSTEPASAEAPAEPRTYVVSYSDLDLASRAGVAEFDRRLRVAIETVCGTASDADPKGRNDVRKCRTATRESLSGSRNAALASAAPAEPIVLTLKQ